MHKESSKIISRIPVVVGCLLLAILISLIDLKTTINSLTIELMSDRESSFRLYYDSGNGYNDEESVAGEVLRRGGKTTIYHFPIPSQKILIAIRIDPDNQPAKYLIKQVSVNYLNDSKRVYPYLTWDAGQIEKLFIPLHDVKPFVLQQGQLLVETVGPNPYFGTKEYLTETWERLRNEPHPLLLPLKIGGYLLLALVAVLFFFHRYVSTRLKEISHMFSKTAIFGMILFKQYLTRMSKAMWMIIAVLIVFVGFGVRYWSLYEDAGARYMKISLKSSVPGIAEVYYDIGQGFTEKNMSAIAIFESEEFREYRFFLPDNETIYNLRFDPLASAGHVEIRQILITDGLGNTLFNFPLKQLVQSDQISRWEIISDHISMDIDKNSRDPKILFKLENPLQFPPEVHSAYLWKLLLGFWFIFVSIFLIYLWVHWSDPNNIKQWSCYGIIAIGLTIAAFYCLQTCLGILNHSIKPRFAGDTEVFLYMAALKWTDPYFYHGLRPFTVPALHSLVFGSGNMYNIILLQTIISYGSWIFLASLVSYFLKNYLVKVFAFFSIAFIPLHSVIYHYNLVILSESLSFSFLAIFLGSYLWYYNKRSILSVIFLAIVAFLFAFTRDTDAYRVLLMTLPILFLIVYQLLNKISGVMRHAVLFVILILIFVGSNYSTSNMNCRDCSTAYVKHRWFMPAINNLFQRVLPFEDRVKYFEDHGLPVTSALMKMKHQWADTNKWQSAVDPELASLREWNHLHGRKTYMKYLITHPKYLFSSAFEYREKLLYLNGQRNIWFNQITKPKYLKILSVFYLNDDHALKVFMVLCPISLILLLFIYVRGHGKDATGRIGMILLSCYIIFITIPLALLIFHGDLMDLDRHAWTNIIQLNLGFVMFYLFMADLLMMKMRSGGRDVSL